MEITPAAPAILSAMPLEAQPVQPVVERQLFDYLLEVQQDSAAHLSNPSALAKDLIHSLEEMIEPAQTALSERRPVRLQNMDLPQTEAANTSRDQPESTQVDTNRDAPGWDKIPFKEVLRENNQFTLDVLWGSLGFNVFAAALSSVNTLIKQQ
ncbi:MAG: hypothetical protein E5W94_05300 [Mesorhizobium sp.]|nr:MAG: hypothetical protein E5W94_05300 [Mesorhizobium sp.]